MKVTAEIRACVPNDIEGQLSFTWNEKQQTMYVYVRQGYKYDPKKGRSVDLRIPAGSIRDGKFKYGPGFLKNREIKRLKMPYRSR